MASQQCQYEKHQLQISFAKGQYIVLYYSLMLRKKVIKQVRNLLGC